MEETLDEILEACEQTLCEEKPDTKGYCALVGVINSIKEHLQGTKTSKIAYEARNDNNYYYTSAGISSEDRNSTHHHIRTYLEGGVPSLNPRLEYLSNEEALTNLSWACSALLIGQVERSICSLPKYSAKTFISALQLASVVLNSGALPYELESIPAPSNSSVNIMSENTTPLFNAEACVVDSKKSTPNNMHSQIAARSTGRVVPSYSPFPERVNIREALVDAVIECGDIVLSKETNERLCFVFIASLSAAAVPHKSRDSSQILSAVDIRYGALQLHGLRLLKVLQLFFSIFSLSSVSLTLVDEVKKALSHVVKAIFNHGELEVRLIEESQVLHFPKTFLSEFDTRSSVTGDTIVPGSDLIQVLKLCSNITQTAPLTSSHADITHNNALHITSPRHDRGSPTPPEKNEIENEVSKTALVSCCNHTALITALSFILQIMSNGGSVFRNTEPVIRCVRQNVIPSVVKTSLSSDIDIFRLSLNILLQCSLAYGPQLVNETSMIFRHVYFRVLESKFTSLMQKLMVVEVFQRYIEEPQNLLNLFLNYDCNTSSYSIYEEMISYLDALCGPLRKCLLIENHDITNAIEGLEELVKVKLPYEVPESLRRKALTTLLLVAESNVQWIDRFKTTDQSKQNCKNDRIAMETSEQDSKGERLNTFQSLKSEKDGGSFAESYLTFEPVNASTIFVHATGGESEEAKGDGNSLNNFCTSTKGGIVSQNEQFLRTKQYKDTVRAFLILFNEIAIPEVAIEYLYSSILMTSRDMNAKEKNETDVLVEVLASVNKASDISEKHAAHSFPANGNPTRSSPTHFAEAINNKDEAVGLEAARKVSVFLFHKRDYLNRLVLGDYFAKCCQSKASRLVLDTWIKQHDFHNMKLDEALRMFLGEFKLLGEAQVVDKTMELFAAHYYRDNPDQFSSAESVFILSYSVCMLNTDAHSPHIKDKMTKEAFIKNNRGIDGGRDVDWQILGQIYDRVTKREIVLRPSKSYRKGSSLELNSSGRNDANTFFSSSNGKRLEGSLLQSIPILRHLSPIAASITDKVLLPIDTFGNNIFGVTQRKQKKIFRKELQESLRQIIEALQSSNNLPKSAFVSATSIENALPMWEISVKIICDQLARFLRQLLQDSESQTFSTISVSNRSQSKGKVLETTVRSAADRDFFEILLHGFANTVNVCCSYGNLKQMEILLEQCFEMTELQQTVIITTKGSVKGDFQVKVCQAISPTRLELLVCFLNLFISSGVSFTARAWELGYTAISLLDALANGLEGMWKRQMKFVSSLDPNLPLPAKVTAGDSSGSLKTSHATQDLWFGSLDEIPLSIDLTSVQFRQAILETVRSFRPRSVDLWLERLFDVTQYPPLTQLQMSSGLVKVCKKELQHARTFSLSKLCDFVTVCASCTTRLQWRELWSNASEIFIMAGKMHLSIANSSLDGLRIIALTYLVREELLNYSFQKEVLMPFEDILMNNHDPIIRKRVIAIISELIDYLAKHLASGWNVVFSCLSHTAVIPEIAELAWEVFENIISKHLNYVKDCFSDFIFCLTTFACVGNKNEKIPLRAISYIVSCGYWLQHGLETPPIGFCEAEDVMRWACHLNSSEEETKSLQSPVKQLVRISVSPAPLGKMNLLEKSSSSTGTSNYHLWVSLFESLIPIVVMHHSVRVRCHAINSIWMLIKLYAVFFSNDIQESLFSIMLRPVLSTLIAHETKPCKIGLDQADYCLLVYLSLNKMLYACSGDSHLQKLGCDTLLVLIKSVSWERVEMLQSSLADIFVRICCDFLAAVFHPKTSEDLTLLLSPPFNSSAPISSNLSLNFVITSGSSFGTHVQRYETRDNCSSTNGLVIDLIDQLRKIGTAEIVRGKRSAAWPELYTPQVNKTSDILFDSHISTDAALERVQETTLRCLYQGLLLPLLDVEKSYCKQDGNNCFLVAQAIRHTMLGMAFYCITTKDIDGVHKLLDTIESPLCENDAVLPLAHLLQIPYLFLLMQFIFSYSMDSLEEGRRLFKEKFSVLTVQLTQARSYCLEREIFVEEGIKHDVVQSNLEVGPPIEKTFKNVFQSGFMTISAKQKYYCSDIGLETRKRIYFECKYLCSVLAIRCILAHQYSSILTSDISSFHLLELVTQLPSCVEEKSINIFLTSVWKEFELHCGVPEETSLEACVRSLRDQMRQTSTP